MVFQKVKDKKLQLMEIYIQEDLRTDYEMDKESYIVKKYLNIKENF